MAKDERRCSPALDCLELNFEPGADEETENRPSEHMETVSSVTVTKTDDGIVQQAEIVKKELKADETTEDDPIKQEAEDSVGRDCPEDLDPLHMDVMEDPEAHEMSMDTEGVEHAHSSEAGEAESASGFAREGETDPRDQKIGPPILSPYLQIHQIEPSSKRALFVRKWQPKAEGGTLHLREQKEQGSAWTQKTRRFLRETLGLLGSLLPKEGQKALLDDIRDFLTQNLSETDLALRIKALVDAYDIVVPLDDGTGLHPWRSTRSSSSAASSAHRSAPATPHTPSSDVPASPCQGAGKRKSPEEAAEQGAGGREGGWHGEARWEAQGGQDGQGGAGAGAKAARTGGADGEGRGAGARGGEGRGPQQSGEGMQSGMLLQTPLSRLLSELVNKTCKPTMPINVRVVAEKISTAGGYLHRSKAIFAFQKVSEEKEIMLFAMYTNEYGTESQAPNAGRVYLECIDSVPLRPNESGEERDAVIKSIMCGYFQYMRSCGFQYVHARVPPPNDVSCQIFARRPAHLRVQSAVWMTRWMRSLLRHAVQSKVIHRFNCGSHGRILNYPPTVLPSNHLLMEIIYAEKEDKICSGHDPSVADLLRERMFVIQLQSQPDHQARAVDKCRPLPLTFASSRRDLNAVLMGERFAFHTLPHAQRATAALVSRLLEEQAKGPQVGERSTAAAGSVRHWLCDDRHDMPPPSQPLRLQLSKRRALGPGSTLIEELTPAEDKCTSALEDELMEYNAGGRSTGWMASSGDGGMELDEDGSRGQIHHQDLQELGSADHHSLFNMDHFD